MTGKFLHETTENNVKPQSSGSSVIGTIPEMCAHISVYRPVSMKYNANINIEAGTWEDITRCTGPCYKSGTDWLVQVAHSFLLVGSSRPKVPQIRSALNVCGCATLASHTCMLFLQTVLRYPTYCTSRASLSETI
jgi:hypothetical protein